MLVNKVGLEAVAVKGEQYPTTGLPEIAFAGKSNVGKSSLINLMINRKSLARTSANPGKTQTINFYNVEDKLYFVDLPGYGYAKVSVADRERWGKMIDYYLKKRIELKLVIQLIDIRHAPGEHDKMMFDWIKHNGFKALVVATKADKINRSQIPKQLKIIREGLGIENQQDIVAFSTLKRFGQEEVWERIEAAIELGQEHTE